MLDNVCEIFITYIFLFQKCMYCKKNSANIRCNYMLNKKGHYKHYFHISCGVKANALYQFENRFPSFCGKHAKCLQDIKQRKIHKWDDICTICQDNMNGYLPVQSILAPCCKNGWFHKSCIMQFATTAGYFFKCPLCNDSKVFREKIVKLGVFIPNKDAEWERETNAFNELLEDPKFCNICEVVRYGRNKKPLQVKICCDMCGAFSAHISCWKEKHLKDACPICLEIINGRTRSSNNNSSIPGEINRSNEPSLTDQTTALRMVGNDVFNDNELKTPIIIVPTAENNIETESRIENINEESDCELIIPDEHMDDVEDTGSLIPIDNETNSTSIDYTFEDVEALNDSETIIPDYEFDDNVISKNNNSCHTVDQEMQLEKSNISLEHEMSINSYISANTKNKSKNLPNPVIQESSLTPDIIKNEIPKHDDESMKADTSNTSLVILDFQINSEDTEILSDSKNVKEVEKLICLDISDSIENNDCLTDSENSGKLDSLSNPRSSTDIEISETQTLMNTNSDTFKTDLEMEDKTKIQLTDENNTPKELPDMFTRNDDDKSSIPCHSSQTPKDILNTELPNEFKVVDASNSEKEKVIVLFNITSNKPEYLYYSKCPSPILVPSDDENDVDNKEDNFNIENESKIVDERSKDYFNETVFPASDDDESDVDDENTISIRSDEPVVNLQIEERRLQNVADDEVIVLNDTMEVDCNECKIFNIYYIFVIKIKLFLF